MTQKDLDTLQSRGITPEKFESQLMAFTYGFPYLKIEAPATVGHGITRPSEALVRQSEEIWAQFLASGAKVMKMVPASGAASRMFKDLFSFLNGKAGKPDNAFMKKWFEEFEKFAFLPSLNRLTLAKYGLSVHSLIREGRYKDVIETLLGGEGLNYGALPKGLLLFHKVMGGARTPLEEHMAEGALYAAGSDHKVHLHLTVSPEHLPLFERKVEETCGLLESIYGVKFDITMSVQKPSTDTVAVTMDNVPFRVDDELFFRPGGHGALIENLNDLDAEVIFIKNIDNVVPDQLKDTTVQYKRVLAGVLVGVKQRINEYCRLIRKGHPTDEQIAEMTAFLRDTLLVTHDSLDEMESNDEKLEYLFSKFNRPLRVCGMVKNEGEPGGGPFLAYNPDGTVSPQILESTQIDPADPEALRMLKEATHFNPVDLVVSTRDWQGHRFDLRQYVDPATGFISSKSVGGVEIKALELPGLWNGAMSDWNTLFIEVPAETFNPVKTVNDLLRPQHA